MIEESRTNLVPTHNSTTNNNSNAAQTLNVAIAPDGTQTASRFAITSTGNVGHMIYNSLGSISNTTFSVFIKGETIRYVGVISHGGSAGVGLFIIDTQEGIITESNSGVNTNTKLVKYPNGWYRFS